MMRQTLGLSVLPDCHLNTTTHLNTVADRVHLFMAMVCQVLLISNWFLGHENEFNLLKQPPYSPDYNPAEYLRGVVEQKIGAVNVHSNCVTLSYQNICRMLLPPS